MSKIVIKRNSEWINKMRDIGIYINGELVGGIKDGKTQEYEVKPGKQEIYAKIDWCRSQKILVDTSNNKTITLKLTGFKYASWFLPVLLGIMLIYFFLKYMINLNLNFLILLVVVMFFYPIYFITFGKNNYLILKQQK